MSQTAVFWRPTDQGKYTDRADQLDDGDIYKPEYFEYACMMDAIGTPQYRQPEGWFMRVREILPNYEEDYLRLQSILYALDMLPFDI